MIIFFVLLYCSINTISPDEQWIKFCKTEPNNPQAYVCYMSNKTQNTGVMLLTREYNQL